jgi:hypothetical protein
MTWVWAIHKTTATIVSGLPKTTCRRKNCSILLRASSR